MLTLVSCTTSSNDNGQNTPEINLRNPDAFLLYRKVTTFECFFKIDWSKYNKSDEYSLFQLIFITSVCLSRKMNLVNKIFPNTKIPPTLKCSQNAFWCDYEPVGDATELHAG